MPSESEANGTGNAARTHPVLLTTAPMPQFSALADVEAALADGRLTRDYQLLVSEKMARADFRTAHDVAEAGVC
jgi:hypothetical protein